jgi:hypothetical protein
LTDKRFGGVSENLSTRVSVAVQAALAAEAESVRSDALRDHLDVLQAELDQARRDAQAVRRGE